METRKVTARGDLSIEILDESDQNLSAIFTELAGEAIGTEEEEL
jgi:hypothetical protein